MAAETSVQTVAFEEPAGTFILHTPSSALLLGHRFQEGMSEAWKRKGRSVLSPEEGPSPWGGKESLSISREEPPNSATHLLRHLCHHGDQLAIAHPIRACFTQTSVEPGVLKTDKCRTLGTGFLLPPFSHTSVVGAVHISLRLHSVVFDPAIGKRTLGSPCQPF